MGDVIFYPDDPRPATWRRPIVALGNFDGLHRGHQKIVERVCRQAREQGATRGGDDLRPAPAAHRPAGQGAAAADDQRRSASRRCARPASTASPSCASPTRCRSGSRSTFVRDVIAGWLHPAEVWVGGNFLFGRDRSGNFSLLRVARPALRLPRRADRPGPLPRLRRQQHARPPADHRGPGRRGGRPARALPLRRRHGGGRGRPRAGRSASRPPTSTTENELLPPQGVYATAVTIGRTVHRAITNIGVRPTFETGGASTSRPTSSGSTRTSTAASCGSSFVLRLRAEQTFPDVAALVAQIRDGLRRGAGALRSPVALDGGIACRLDTIARMSGTSQGFGEHGAFTVSVAGDPRLVETVHELTRKTAEMSGCTRRGRGRTGRRRHAPSPAPWPTTSTWPTGRLPQALVARSPAGPARPGRPVAARRPARATPSPR